MGGDGSESSTHRGSDAGYARVRFPWVSGVLHQAVSPSSARKVDPVRCRVAGAVTLAIGLGLYGCGTPSSVVSTATAPGTARQASAAPSAKRTSNPSPQVSRIAIARSGIRLPFARSRGVALAFGPVILLCGGLASDGTTSGAIVRVDLRTARASTVGTMATPVHDAGGAVLGGLGLIIGGGASAPTDVAQEVNASAASSIVGALPANRADLVAVAVDGELVVVGGGTPARNDDRVLATTDGRTFRLVARLVVPVRYPAVAVASGLVYVIGGRTATGDSNLVQAVDPGTGTTRIVGHLVRGLSHASAFVLGDALLVAGGRTAGVAQDVVWRIDLARGTAYQAGTLPYPVSDMASAVVDGVAYLIGGEQVGPARSSRSRSNEHKARRLAVARHRDHPRDPMGGVARPVPHLQRIQAIPDHGGSPTCSTDHRWLNAYAGLPFEFGRCSSWR